jgi:hypothetical protein
MRVFGAAVATFGRNFGRVAKRVGGGVSVPECIAFYYDHWKYSPAYRAWKAIDVASNTIAGKRGGRELGGAGGGRGSASASPSPEPNDPPSDHDDACAICEQGGEILCCDTCNLAFHLRCLVPPMVRIPEVCMSTSIRIQHTHAAYAYGCSIHGFIYQC